MKLRIVCRVPTRDMEEIDPGENFRRKVRYASEKEAKKFGRGNYKWIDLEKMRPTN